MEIKVTEDEVDRIMADAAGTDVDKCIAAFKRLGAFKYAPAAQVLSRRFSDPNAYIRRVCAEEAEDIMGPQAVHILEACLYDSVVEIGMEAAGALARIGTDAAARILLRALRECDWVTLTHGLYGMAYWRSKAGVPAILEALKKPEAKYPEELALALARCGAVEHLPLIELLHSCTADEKVRLRYAAAITMLGRDMRPDISQGLASQWSDVKKAALACVRELGDRSFFLDIVPLLRDRDTEVAEEADATLELLGLTQKGRRLLSRGDISKLNIRRLLPDDYKLEAED